MTKTHLHHRVELSGSSVMTRFWGSRSTGLKNLSFFFYLASFLLFHKFSGVWRFILSFLISFLISTVLTGASLFHCIFHLKSTKKKKRSRSKSFGFQRLAIIVLTDKRRSCFFHH